VSRIVFVGCYLCTYGDDYPEVFGSDWFIITLLTFFSISCGYLSNVGMIYGSDSSTGNQPLAGSIMGFHLTFGICAGSAIALIFFS